MAKVTQPGQHGGYRAPAKPAAVSGPGKYAQRTDGKPGAQAVRAMTGGAYGEATEMDQLQSSAPMSDTSGLPAPSGLPQALAGSGVVPMDHPTERPDEPATSGIDIGAGPGADAMGQHMATLPEDLQKLKGYLPLLALHLDNEQTPDSVRAMYRMLRDAT